MLEIEERLSALLYDSSYSWNPTYSVSAYSRPNWPIVCSDNKERIRIANWGFIPEWVKDLNQADKIALATVNGRAETLNTKPSFKNSIHNRCLIPVTAFFEPHHYNKKVIPYLFCHKEGEMFALGGLYCESEYSNSPSGRGFTIITIDADEETAKIHNKKKRMPLWIPKEEWSNWLNSSESFEQWKELVPKVRPFNYYSVSNELYKKKRTIRDEELLKPVHYDELDQQELF